MLIGIIGENCSGKSTLAHEIKNVFGGEVITGKDYLKMAKSECEAMNLFRSKLEKAILGDHLIYVISEKEQLDFLPDGAIRILVRADIETIKERFKMRMHGNLPFPVAQMLERKHGIFDGERYDYQYDGVSGNPEEICARLMEKLF